jgi:hypothetical protein
VKPAGSSEDGEEGKLKMPQLSPRYVVVLLLRVAKSFFRMDNRRGVKPCARKTTDPTSLTCN